MKKLFVLFAFLFFSATNVALSQPVFPTAPPQPAFPVQNVQFFGSGWVLAFYNGSRVTMSGEVTIPYSEMHITFNGGQVNSDGSKYWFGSVDGEYGSSVTVSNSNIDKHAFRVSVYVQDTEFGISNQYTSTECQMFIAPKGNDYLHGMMSAIQYGTDWNGNWVQRAIFGGQAELFHSLPPPGPMMPTPPGDKG